MSPDSYLDFDLLIEADGPNYRASVIDSPAGQSDNSFTLPFSEKDLELLVLQVFRLTSRRAVRAIASPEMRDVRAFGGHLFESIFSGPVSTCLLRSMDEADRSQRGLRVRLHLGDAPSLANVPWEFLYDSSSDGFLCLSDQTPVVRYIDLPQRVEPLAASPPLRMLCLISSPAGYPPLDVEHEWAKLSEALGPTVKEGRLLLERVDTPSLEALQRKLRRDEYHVLHFVGHGGFDEQAQDGVLLFEDLEGKGHPVSGESLGVLLHDHESLRLVVLNACEGARTSSTDPFAGTAQSLVRKGIPAVIAMQFEISDEAAITLANEFYSAVADGYPVDAALSEARKAIFTRVNAVEWATPVLYMRSPDGRIFEIEDRAERLEARTLRHEEPLVPVPTPESGPVGVAQPPAPEPETHPVAVEPAGAEPATQPVAAERLTHPVPPPPEVEPVKPSRPQAARPVGRPAKGGLLGNRKVVIPVAIGAVLLLLIGIGAALNNNNSNPGPSGRRTVGPTTAPPATGTPTLSDLVFVPVSNVQRGGSGEMLRAASGPRGLEAVGREGSSGAVWLSEDGSAWTRALMPTATPGAAGQVQGIVQRGPLLVAVGYETARGQEYAAVWTSSDGGSRWLPRDQPSFHGAGPTRMNRAALDGDFFIAVGRSGDDAVLWSSSDGMTWKADATGVFNARPGERLALRDAFQGTNHEVVVGEDSTSGAAAWYRIKDNGFWTRAKVDGANPGQSLISVTGGPDRFVAVGYATVRGDDDAAVWTSPDGTSWERAPTRSLHESGQQRMRGVSYVGDLGFVAVGIDGSNQAAVWISTDGLQWTRSKGALQGGGQRRLTGVVSDDLGTIVVGQDDGRPAVWLGQFRTG